MIQINAPSHNLVIDLKPYLGRKRQMTTDTVLAIIVITIPFLIFAGVLFWAERQTRTRV